MTKYTDEVLREFIEIEKMLCDAIGRPWTPTGMSIVTLTADIKTALAAQQGGVREAEQKLSALADALKKAERGDFNQVLANYRAIRRSILEQS